MGALAESLVSAPAVQIRNVFRRTEHIMVRKIRKATAPARLSAGVVSSLVLRSDNLFDVSPISSQFPLFAADRQKTDDCL